MQKAEQNREHSTFVHMSPQSVGLSVGLSAGLFIELTRDITRAQSMIFTRLMDGFQYSVRRLSHNISRYHTAWK